MTEHDKKTEDASNEVADLAKNNSIMKIIRMAVIAVIAVVIFGLLFLASNSGKQSPAEQVWHESATVGNLDAKNYYIMYTDLMCPYCDVFSRVVMEHWDEFESYLEENDILFEIRLTDYLYEGSGIKYSRDAAEGAYCAMREDKFWDYYHGALEALWKDYHSKGIGDSKTSPAISNLPKDYWRKIGHQAGLGDNFDKCLEDHETVEEIEEKTERALQVAEGMPFFKFNKFTTSGFDNNWGWDYVKRYLDAGLGKSK